MNWPVADGADVVFTVTRVFVPRTFSTMDVYSVPLTFRTMDFSY